MSYYKSFIEQIPGESFLCRTDDGGGSEQGRQSSRDLNRQSEGPFNQIWPTGSRKVPLESLR